jgi:hypothetical protein
MIDAEIGAVGSMRAKVNLRPEGHYIWKGKKKSRVVEESLGK